MENKYIITLEEIPFERFHSYNVPSERLYRVQGFNSLVFDGNGLSRLTPYTEPDLDAVRNKAYEKGVQDTKQHWVDAPRSCAYKLGYENGLKAAWDTARKIVLSREVGGLFEYEARKSVFGCGNYMVLKNYSASEAIEKIRQYEQIQIGDEVEMKCGVGPAIYMQGTKGSDEIYLLFNDGSCGVHSKSEIERKTGRHFPEIAEVLRKMKEEKK